MSKIDIFHNVLLGSLVVAASSVGLSCLAMTAYVISDGFNHSATPNKAAMGSIQDKNCVCSPTSKSSTQRTP
jgi:hypothetical protein